MKKDIPQPKVSHLAIAVVPRPRPLVPEEIELWDCYLINLREEPIQNVLISSKGYGEVDGERLSTTTLRHFFEEIPPRSVHKIEPIQTKLFNITNEYWVSFNHGDHMYDKKYVFVKGSITDENFTKVPLVEKRGVMIK